MSRRSRGTIGPNVVVPTMTESNPRSTVERIAAFAAAARPEHLTNDTRRLLKRNILDSLGCAIAALQGQPFQALREQFEEYRAPGRCTLIGGGKHLHQRPAGPGERATRLRRGLGQPHVVGPDRREVPLAERTFRG